MELYFSEKSVLSLLFAFGTEWWKHDFLTTYFIFQVPFS